VLAKSKDDDIKAAFGFKILPCLALWAFFGIGIFFIAHLEF
jgi:hypothetical protein